MKHRMLNAGVGLALAGALASTAVARPLQSCAAPARAAVRLGPDKIARIDLLLADIVAKKIAPGAVVLIEQDGRIAYRRTLGMADAEAARPMHADSLFRIFSMTKPVTSVAALQLVARGKLSLDAPLSRYIPEFAGTGVWPRYASPLRRSFTSPAHASPTAIRPTCLVAWSKSQAASASPITSRATSSIRWR
jgi:CubicO group peptidase (beta-lactamase class C family)